VPYVQQDLANIVDKAVELIIEQMEGESHYAPRRETVPVTFVADMGSPTPEGV
jgi:DNA-binding LacI/PurR family transcriptional regulator